MLLKKGDNNENVKLMQQKLGIEPAVTNFGPKTEAAVKEWQAKNGLTADGIVGPSTWAKIMGESAEAPTPIVSTPIASVGGLKLEKLKLEKVTGNNNKADAKIAGITPAWLIFKGK